MPKLDPLTDDNQRSPFDIWETLTDAQRATLVSRCPP